MFVLTTNNSVVDRGIAAVLAIALVLWAVGAHYTVQAAGLTAVSNVLSTSAPGEVADHTISFTLPDNAPGATGIDADDQIRITFPAGFTIGALVDGDFAVDLGSGDEPVPANVTQGATGQVITLTSVSATAAQADVATIVISNGKITNPTATGSQEILIEVYDEGTTLQDSASTMVFISDQVIVTADVDPIFEFEILGVAAVTTIDAEDTDVTTSTTTIPFGTLAPAVAKVAAQELRVVTNAVGGFAVTVETDQQLTASNNADIDSFVDGADTSAPTAWAAPTGTIGTEDSYGHWGFRTSDATNIAQTYANGAYTALFTTPTEVFTHTGPTDGVNSPEDAGFTQVMYKAQIMSFQEAADDYTATLTYIATPTF